MVLPLEGSVCSCDVSHDCHVMFLQAEDIVSTNKSKGLDQLNYSSVVEVRERGREGGSKGERE